MPTPTATPAPAPRTDLSDDDLMLAYVSGDTSAFDTLYARHEQAFYRFVQRLLSARLAAEVDEVFQEVWVRIVTARTEFSAQQSAWRIWALSVAHDLVMDRLRASGRQSRLSTRDFVVDKDSDHGDDGDSENDEAVRLASIGGGVAVDMEGRSDDAMDARAEAEAAHPAIVDAAFWRLAGRRLLACLNELTDEQRAVFLLHHEDGFTDEKLAEVLGVGPDVLRNRLRHASRTLRACMRRDAAGALEETV